MVIALLAVPQMINSVTIFTDSQASLDGINGFKPQNTRKYSQSPNESIIEQIIRIILIKQLSISWVKVKGHSGNTHNDAADDLAQKAAKLAQDQNSIIIAPTYKAIHSSMQFKLSWNNYHWHGQLRNRLSTFASLS